MFRNNKMDLEHTTELLANLEIKHGHDSRDAFVRGSKTDKSQILHVEEIYLKANSELIMLMSLTD